MSSETIPARVAVAAFGEAALAMQVGPTRFSADRKNRDHRFRRLLSEFIGTAALTFGLSAGAAILAFYGGAPVAPYQAALILSAVSALWLVAAEAQAAMGTPLRELTE